MKHRLLSLSLTLLVSTFSSSAIALTSTVTPALLRMSISNAKPQDSSAIALTNNNSTDVTYVVSVVDVDVATGSLLPKNTVSDITKQLVQVSPNTVVLQAGKSINIAVTANNNEKLPPGGHYAAVKIEPQITAVKKVGSNLQQAVSVPVFIVKEDGVDRSHTARLLSTKKIYIGSLPKQKVSIKNTGNVDIIPRGFISYTRGSNTISKQAYNETSVPLFAGQERTYEAEKPTKSPSFVGKVNIIASNRADSESDQNIVKQTAYFIPWWLVWIFVILILALGFWVRLRYGKKDSKPKTKNDETVKKAASKKPKTSGINEPNDTAKAKKPKKAPTVSDFGSTKGIK